MITTPLLFWTLLAIFNFAVQIAYFCTHRSKCLFTAKRVSTPLLLFSAAGVSLFQLIQLKLAGPVGPEQILPMVLLIAMGIGELGIEGSQVVEAKENPNGIDDTGGKSPVSVILAGVLFLLVNVVLGVYLLLSHGSSASLALSAGAAGAVLIVLTLLLIIARPPKREQIIIYGIGVAILAAGAGAGMIGRAGGTLAQAAAVLTISDTLVLIRMASGWKKSNPLHRRVLLLFLLVILLLYYLFMVLMAGGF